MNTRRQFFRQLGFGLVGGLFLPHIIKPSWKVVPVAQRAAICFWTDNLGVLTSNLILERNVRYLKRKLEPLPYMAFEELKWKTKEGEVVRSSVEILQGFAVTNITEELITEEL